MASSRDRESTAVNLGSPLRRTGMLLALFYVLLHAPLRAQDHTLLFDTRAVGVSRPIEEWGLDVTWPSQDNMRRGLIYMGAGEVDMVRVAFLVNAPLVGGDLPDAQKMELNVMADLASMAGPAKPCTLSCGTGAGVDPWYKTGNDVIPSRWVQAIEAAARHYDRTIISIEAFNEPDFGWGQGTVQNLYDILGLLRASPLFGATALAGASTLNCDNAGWWYDQIKSRATEGTTHALGGSFHNYAAFFENVIASGDAAVNPEVHNLVEVIAGAEYGLEAGIWWGTAELARGEFVKACQGRRLGYAEDHERWTAAAVYRAPGGDVQAFLGGSERMGQTTTFRFLCRDRDVFYDGDGPRRDYTVTIQGDQEKVIDIAWGDDVPPVIDGRYIVVSRSSGKVIEVAGASTGDGANIRQNSYTAGSHQHWDIAPFSSALGDQSFYSMTAAHSGKSADVNNWSFGDGANVQQWDNHGGANQLWFFEYAGNGYFYIRNRWSGKYLDVAGASVTNGANVWQWTGLGARNQQWRLIPVGAAVEFAAPAPPTGVAAVANPLSVRLTWNANMEADLAGYTVLRAFTSGGPYEIVARGLTSRAFTDRSANQTKPHFYVLKAVDGSQNASGISEEVRATPTGGPALIAHCALDGSLLDSSVNGNHAVTIGSPGFVQGRYGRSLDLDGSGQYALLPAGFLASVTDFTIAVWVRWGGGPAWQRVFDLGNDTTQYMFLTPSSGSGTLRFAMTTNGPGAEQIVETSVLDSGTWQHVAVTLQGSTCRIYTNGVLAASGSVTISPGSIDPVLNYLGESHYEADPLFDGRLDELYVYNYALSTLEIARLMENDPPAPGGLQIPGDGNQDGKLDLSDAIWLLGHLFLGANQTLPCEGRVASSPGPGELALLDHNGDGTIDISDAVAVLGYLFSTGQPPILGSTCRVIAGCPTACEEP